jgi:hypothetical protein
MRPTPSSRHALYLSLLAVMDCFLTYTILFVFPAYGVYGAELNGVANTVLSHFGFGGMVVLKGLSVMPAMGAMNYVSKRSLSASRVLSAATLSVGAFPVVVALSQMAMLAMGVTK